MKNKTWIIVGIVLFLFFCTLLIIPFLFDINYLKPKIKVLLEEQLNAQVDLGSLKLSLIKGIEIEAKDVTISNPPSFPQDSLLKAEKVSLRLGTLYSLIGNPTITLKISKPKIHIFRNEKKEFNIFHLWKEKVPQKENPHQSIRDELPKGMIGSLLIRSHFLIELLESEVLYFHQDHNPFLTLQNIECKIGPINLEKDIPIEFYGILNRFIYKDLSLEGPLDASLTITNPIITTKTVHARTVLNLEKTRISHPLFVKKENQQLSIDMDNNYSKNTLITRVKSQLLESNIEFTATIQNFETFPFKLEGGFQITEKEFFFPYDVNIGMNLTTNGNLKPFSIDQMSGKMDVQNISGEIPPLLKPILEKYKIALEGKGKMKTTINFSIKDDSHSFEFHSTEVDLSQSTLNIPHLGVKAKDVPFVLKATILFVPKEKKLLFSKASINGYDSLLTFNQALLLLTEDPFIDIQLLPSQISLQSLTPLFSKYPITMKGRIDITKLFLKGNINDLFTFEGDGSFQTSEAKLEFPFKKDSQIKLQHAFPFELNTAFSFAQKQFKYLNIKSSANLSNVAMNIKNQFIKDADTTFLIHLDASLENNILNISNHIHFHDLKALIQGHVYSPFLSNKRSYELSLTASPVYLSNWHVFFPAIKQENLNGNVEIKTLKISWPEKNINNLSLKGSVLLKNFLLEIPQEFIRTKSIHVQGPIKLNLESTFDYARRKIKQCSIKGHILLTQTLIKIQNFIEKKANIPFSLDIHANSEKDTLYLKTSLNLDKMKSTLSGRAIQISKNPLFDLHLDTSSFSVSDLSRIFPSLKLDPIKGNVRLNADIKGTLKESDPFSVNFKLTSNALEYLSPQVSETKDELAVSKKDSKEPKSSFLRRLQANGSINILKASYKDFKFWNLFSNLNYKNNVLVIDPLKFDFYDGNFKSRIEVHTNKKEPFTKVSSTLKNMNLEKFFISQKSKLAGRFSGFLDASLDASMVSFEKEKMKRSLWAKGNVLAQNGYFKIFNLTEALSQLPIINQVVPNLDLRDDYSSLQSSLLIKNEKLATPDIFLKGKNHLLKAEGSVDFDGRLNYTGIYYLSEIEDINKQIPFTVTGTLSHPNPSPDVGKLLQNTVQGVFEKILMPKKETKEPSTPDTKKEKKGSLIEELLKEGLPLP